MSDSSASNLSEAVAFYKYHIATVTVYAEETTTINYDFGMSYTQVLKEWRDHYVICHCYIITGYHRMFNRKRRNVKLDHRYWCHASFNQHVWKLFMITSRTSTLPARVRYHYFKCLRTVTSSRYNK